jgi:hypothetical protein
MVDKAGKIGESYFVEERLLRDNQENPQERKSNTRKGKK